MFDYDLKFAKPKFQNFVSEKIVREMVLLGIPEIRIDTVDELSGGYSNSNFSVVGNLGRFVCRVSSKGEKPLNIEHQLSKRLGEKLCPRVFYVGVLDNLSFSIVDFVEGALLSNVWKHLEPADLEQILVDLGGKLSRVHSHKFAQSGFFGPNLNIEETFYEGAGTACEQFIESSLSSNNVKERLGAELFKGVQKYLFDNKYLFNAVDKSNCLVHSDFNTKNIMVSVKERKVTGILDWEYAHSGNPLCDFGNFLRFEDETDFDVVKSLMRGYGKNRDVFIKDWRKISRLLDLASMFGFLTRENLPELTLRTSKKVIYETILR